ncbi:hypothetical protein IFM89_005263 [Coptis chinensis]|uniref:Root phototropism protein n=1 Tax=Coptis chinensis TaxID=261450 RepID=A0A835MHB8_9MAGN|nr:hypothetical protein IFM89_005263 [Coptis chinensis]
MTMKSLQVDRPQKPGSDYNGVERVNDQSTVIPVPNKRVNITEKFNEYERSWFPTQTPTDVIIQVEDVNFYVHKLPLISRSEYLSQLNRRSHSSDNGYDFKLDNFPGGVETFETVLKFCYGLPVDLTPTNIATLRCAAEFLQMTEEYEESNLIAKTEAFLTFIVLSSWRDSITVVKSCESLSPWAENLQIVRRCTIKAKGTKPEVIGACIMHYAEKWLPSTDAELKKPNKSMGLVYLATPALVSELEKRVGMVLEDATVNDLLIPTYNNGTERKAGSPSCEDSSMQNVDIVQRMVEYFLMHEQQQQQQLCGNLNVGKLLDGYLAEVARDPNLSIFKFQALAEVLPQNSRICHDGLYRAIDTYLKTHPTLTEHDRRRLCKAMDCDKLSLDACMHAAQNDRLPLRTVMQVTFNYKVIDMDSKVINLLRMYPKMYNPLRAVSKKEASQDCNNHEKYDMQVLFSEQVKMRAAMKENEPKQHEIVFEQDGRLSTKKEIKTIMCELQKIRTQMAELQHDYSDLQREFDKLNKQKSISGWSSGWKKLKNSTLFYAKTNGVDGEEVHPGQTPASCKSHRNRSQSIS